MSVARELDLSQFQALLERTGEEIARLDFTRPLKTILVLIKTDVRSNFYDSHTPDGLPWLPLKKPSKKRGGRSAKPLLDKGLLAASISANGQGHVEEVTKDSLLVGSTLEYAGWQNDGTRTIPAREFAGFSPKLLTEIDEVLAEYLADQAL